MPKQKNLVVFLVLGLAAAVMLVFIVRATEPSLIDRSTIIVGMKEWSQLVWLSDSEMLLIHEGEGHRYKIIAVNLKTGTKSRAELLEKVLSGFNNDGIISSSDGKWLLCLPFDGEDEA